MLFRHLFNRGTGLIIAALISQGCSNNFVQAVGPTFSTADEFLNYFPLDAGYNSTYEVRTSSGTSEIIAYTVGEDVSFQGAAATPWIKNGYDRKDTSYFVLSGSSLVFYDSKTSSPEVILEFPLSVGNSWSRFDIPETEISDSAGDDGISNKDTTKFDDGSSLSATFFSDGQPLMTVDKLESVELSNGRYYSGVYRVSNDAGGGARNYYWYAPGVGMIKFVLGSTASDDPTGGVQAELIYYSYIN